MSKEMYETVNNLSKIDIPLIEIENSESEEIKRMIDSQTNFLKVVADYIQVTDLKNENLRQIIIEAAIDSPYDLDNPKDDDPEWIVAARLIVLTGISAT